VDDDERWRQRLGSGGREVLDSDLPTLPRAGLGPGDGGNSDHTDEKDNGQTEQEALHRPSFDDSGFGPRPHVGGVASVHPIQGLVHGGQGEFTES
jgi:hypothetical protein